MTDLPRPVPLGRVIATRRFTIKGKPNLKPEVRIGTPKRMGRDSYCPVQLVGIGDGKVRPVYGVDTLQALQLALRYVEPLLLRFGDSLRWESAPAHKSLDTDPWTLFEGAGLSEFLSKFAELCSDHVSKVGSSQLKGGVRDARPMRRSTKRP